MLTCKGVISDNYSDSKDESSDYIDFNGSEVISDAVASTTQRKPAGCIDVNGKLIDVQRLIRLISAGLSKEPFEIVLRADKKRFFLFTIRDKEFRGIRVAIQLLEPSNTKNGFSDYSLGWFKSGNKNILSDEAFVEFIRAVRDENVVLDSIQNTIWDSHKSDNPKKISTQSTASRSNSRTINDLTREDMLLHLELIGNSISSPTKSFVGLPYVSSFGSTREKLTNSFVAQIKKHKSWITQNGGERVKIAVSVQPWNYSTQKERLRILSDYFDFIKIESRLNALLSEATPCLMASQRLVNSKKKLVGLVLNDGSRLPLAQCIKLAQDGKISNIKAVSRAGVSPYLQGNRISLESLPYINV